MKLVPFDRAQHFNFVLDAVLKSNRSGFDGAHSTTADYYAFREPYWARILGLPETITHVATSPESEEQFIGFVIGTKASEIPGRKPGMVLHYVYVKQAFRQFGVAKNLVDSLGETVRYYSTIPKGWKWRKAREYEWHYEPHQILARLYADEE